MKRKRILIILIAAVLLLSTSLYVHSKYFFNPLTFKEDNITYLPFSWYEKPMKYSYVSFVNGNIKGENIEREKDIKFIYAELKKSKIIGPVQLKNGTVTSRQFVGGLVINSPKCTVTVLKWFGKDSEVCEVSGEYIIDNKKTNTQLEVELTSDLKKFLLSKFQE